MTEAKISDIYTPRGQMVNAETIYTVIGLPKLKGKWVTVAHNSSGKVFAMPGDEFDTKFRRAE